MILTKEQQAQKYAEKIAGNTCMAPVIAETWLAGYTAAEQSQWRSAEEELPEEDSHILTVSRNGYYSVANFSKGKFINAIQVVAWMSIPTPSLPDTNTEKK